MDYRPDPALDAAPTIPPRKDPCIMKATVPAVAVVLTLAGPCFALWSIATVTKERAKELGIVVRSQAAGPNAVRVEMDFAAEGELQGYSRVELRVGEGDKPTVTAALREDRPKPGRCVVSFSADRAQLDRLTLRVMVPGGRGGAIYEVRVRDFIEPDKAP